MVRSVLASYLEQYEEGIASRTIPRFLLNDVVRYWRTITVDAAAKVRERGEQGWQIRRLKLRTSRKLIFSAGLVMSLDAHVLTNESGDGLLDALAQHVQETPLARLARAALASDAQLALARPVFEAYDRFLSLIDDREARAFLEQAGPKEAENNEMVAEARAIGRAFGEAIENFFFDSTSLYATAMRRYGVF